MKVSTVNLNQTTPVQKHSYHNSKILPTFEDLFTPKQSQLYKRQEFLGDSSFSQTSSFRQKSRFTTTNQQQLKIEDTFNSILLRNSNQKQTKRPEKIEIYQNFTAQKCFNQIVPELADLQEQEIEDQEFETICFMNKLKERGDTAKSKINILNVQKKVESKQSQIHIKRRQFRGEKVQEFCGQYSGPLIDMLVKSQGLINQIQPSKGQK